MSDQVKDQKKPSRNARVLGAVLVITTALGAWISSHPRKAPSEGGPATGPEYTLKLFFSNSKMDPGMERCNKVYETRRGMSSPIGPKEAVERLLRGPDEGERARGYFTSIPEGTVLGGVTVRGATAYADFSELSAAGACRVEAIRAQITETLKANVGVSRVVLSVKGDASQALQP